MQEPIPSVNHHSFHDSSVGRTFYCDVYLDRGEWAVHSTTDSRAETCDPSQHAQEKWDAFVTRRRKIRQMHGNLMDTMKHMAECPVCGERLRSVQNEWVRRQIHGCPDYETPGEVRFCGECGVNTWNSSGNITSGRCIGMNAIEEGSDLYIGRTYNPGSTPRSKKNRLIRDEEDTYQECVEFYRDLQELREKNGYDRVQDHSIDDAFEILI